MVRMGSSTTSSTFKKNPLLLKNMSKSLKVRPEVCFDGKKKSLNAKFIQKNTQVHGTSIFIQNYKMSSSLLFPDIFLLISLVC